MTMTFRAKVLGIYWTSVFAGCTGLGLLIGYGFRSVLYGLATTALGYSFSRLIDLFKNKVMNK